MVHKIITVALLLCVQNGELAAQTDSDVSWQEVAQANARMKRYGASIVATPMTNEVWKRTFVWAPNDLNLDDMPEVPSDFPDISTFKIDSVILRSDYLPEGLVLRLQELESELAVLQIVGSTLEDAHIIELVTGMNARIDRLVLTCPQISPQILASLDQDMIGHVLIVGDEQLRKNFIDYVLNSEERVVSCIIVPEVTTRGRD